MNPEGIDIAQGLGLEFPYKLFVDGNQNIVKYNCEFLNLYNEDPNYVPSIETRSNKLKVENLGYYLATRDAIAAKKDGRYAIYIAIYIGFVL